MNQPAEAAPSRPLTGILILLGAVACFACMDASAKWLNRDLQPLQIAGVRYVVSLLAVLAFLRPSKTPGVFRAKRPGLQIVGALLFALTVFDETPDRWTLLGAAIVIGSGLYLLHRERLRRVPPSTDVAV